MRKFKVEFVYNIAAFSKDPLKRNLAENAVTEECIAEALRECFNYPQGMGECVVSQYVEDVDVRDISDRN